MIVVSTQSCTLQLNSTLILLEDENLILRSSVSVHIYLKERQLLFSTPPLSAGIWFYNGVPFFLSSCAVSHSADHSVKCIYCIIKQDWTEIIDYNAVSSPCLPHGFSRIPTGNGHSRIGGTREEEEDFSFGLNRFNWDTNARHLPRKTWTV